MKRTVLFILGAIAVSTSALAQAQADVDKALGAAPAQLREGATVIKWKSDFTYETLKKGTNRLVCYDKSGMPKQMPFMVECTSLGNLDRAAQNIKFDTACMQAAANQPFKIDFDNKDAGTPHNVAIFDNSTLAQNLFRGAIITGVSQVTYSVNPLPAGTYYFHCDVHPGMNGTFKVQ